MVTETVTELEIKRNCISGYGGQWLLDKAATGYSVTKPEQIPTGAPSGIMIGHLITPLTFQ